MKQQNANHGIIERKSNCEDVPECSVSFCSRSSTDTFTSKSFSTI